MLFQRRTSRRSGFIRKKQSHEMSLIGQFKTQRQFYLYDTQQFSPFKDSSPQPIDKILQTHRHFETTNSTQYNNKNKKIKFVLPAEHKQISKQIQRKYENNFDKQIKIQHNEQNKKGKDSLKQKKQRPIYMQIQRQKNQLYSDYSAFFDSRTKKLQNNFSFLNKNSSPQINFTNNIQTQQQIRQITVKPSQFSLTLAQSFNLNCKRLKDKLQDQRRRFSISRSPYRSRVVDQASKMLKKQLKQKNSRSRLKKQNGKQNSNTFNLSRSNIGKRQNQSFSQNVSHDTSINIHAQNRPPTNSRKKSNSFVEKKKPSELQTSKMSFFVPVTPRQRSITPRQAYQHSYKKWKQLPEIVAKEKVKQKEKHMRQRMIKMRAHSQQVRKNLRR